MIRFVSFILLLLAGAAAHATTLLIVGDSLSAAYGIAANDGWVTLLEERLKQKRFDYSLVNASISGETTSGGASRIDELLARAKPRVVIVALGGNDGLRGLPVGQIKENLSRIVEAARKHDARVLLAGVRIPPNYGPHYVREFRAVFSDVAKRYSLAFVPFMLKGVGERREYMQPDGIHPNAAAQPKILENIWVRLEPLLEKQ